MKTKIIETVITKKIDHWLRSIKDKKIRDYISDKIVVTGGCITSMLLNEKINDFDVYLKDKKSVKLLAQYYCKEFNKKNKIKNKLDIDIEAYVLDGEDVELYKQGKKRLTEIAKGYTNDNDTPSGMILNTSPDRIKIMINSDGIASNMDYVDNCEINMRNYLNLVNSADDIDSENLEDDKEYKPVFFSTNAITLSNKIQITLRFYGEASHIHENYDFIHCTNYWDSYDNKIYLNKEALESILTKQLIYVGSKYPICSMIRTRKFIKKDWNINAGQYLKMAFHISKLDLEDISVLEDQLVGVDSLYFLAVVDELKKAQTKNNTIDQTYVVSVIDKIFN